MVGERKRKCEKVVITRKFKTLKASLKQLASIRGYYRSVLNEAEAGNTRFTKIATTVKKSLHFTNSNAQHSTDITKHYFSSLVSSTHKQSQPRRGIEFSKTYKNHRFHRGAS